MLFASTGIGGSMWYWNQHREGIVVACCVALRGRIGTRRGALMSRNSVVVLCALGLALVVSSFGLQAASNAASEEQRAVQAKVAALSNHPTSGRADERRALGDQSRMLRGRRARLNDLSNVSALVGALVIIIGIARRPSAPTSANGTSSVSRASAFAIIVASSVLLVGSGVASYKADEIRPGWCSWYPGIYCEDTPEARRQTARFDRMSQALLTLSVVGFAVGIYRVFRRRPTRPDPDVCDPASDTSSGNSGPEQNEPGEDG
jgi:hypothetical protein